MRIIRSRCGVEVRGSADAPRIDGYAAVFYRDGDPGTEFELWGGGVERIRPTAFANALKDSQDVVALFNHDASQVLGRRSAGTLKLKSDDRGLHYSIDAATARGRDLAASIRRGDINGSSFSFIPTETSIEQRSKWDYIVWIEDLELLDVGPVTFPAYTATEAEARCLHAVQRSAAAARRRRTLVLAGLDAGPLRPA